MNAKHEYVTLNQAVEARPWLTVRYLRRLVNEHRIVYSKVGNKLLFDLAVIDRLVEDCKVPDPRQDPLPRKGGVTRGAA